MLLTSLGASEGAPEDSMLPAPPMPMPAIPAVGGSPP